VDQSKNLQNFDLLGVLEIGVRKVATFTAKGTSLCQYMSFELFCVKVRWGGVWRWPSGVIRKSQKVSDSHRNDDCVAVNTGLALPRSMWY